MASSRFHMVKMAAIVSVLPLGRNLAAPSLAWTRTGGADQAAGISA
jgi:hypothetical protein